MLRIGIIGMSGYVAEHWRDLGEVQRRGGCRIVATAVVDAENHTARLQQVRGDGVEVFTSVEEMFDAMRGRMDAVTIPTPIHTHPAMMIAAVQSGYHVYLEKPPAATIQELDEMIAACKRTGKLCAVGFQAMWSESMALMKLRVSEGALGEIESVACSSGWIRKQDYYIRNDWVGRLRIGGAWVLDGPSNNALAHQITNILYLASPNRRTLATPVAVRAELYSAHEIESEDTSAIEIITAEGPRCYFVATQCADEQFDPEITIIGSKATAYRHFLGRVGIRYNDGRREEPACDDARQYTERFENFISAIEAGEQDRLRCHLEMCRPFTLAVNGAFESAGSIRRVPPEYVSIGGEGLSTKTVIRGIDAAIPQAASQRVLLSDLDIPWARHTATFDLTGYRAFPVQFNPGQPRQTDQPGQLPFA